jgi:hypothetical protein
MQIIWQDEKQPAPFLAKKRVYPLSSSAKIVFATESVQNQKSFWRSSQNYFVFALFC